MLYNTLHHQKMRLMGGVLGQLIVAIAINLFIVPIGLYSGGTIGICQLIRTALQTFMGFGLGNHDIAGGLYLLSNIPILIFAYRCLGRNQLVKTVACTCACSLFCSIIPIPTVPIINDSLTACLVGGVVNAVGSGLTLTCGCSSGGLETIGVCLSKLGNHFSFGKISLTFNIFLYAVYFVLFIPEVAIYSLIYNFFAYLLLDRVHQQNVNVQALIFTHESQSNLNRFVIDNLGRSVTYWKGTGAYTSQEIQVLCICLGFPFPPKLYHRKGFSEKSILTAYSKIPLESLDSGGISLVLRTFSPGLFWRFFADPHRDPHAEMSEEV